MCEMLRLQRLRRFVPISRSEIADQYFLQDTRIVCKDGHLLWNALLLSQWSNVVKSFMRQFGDHVTPEKPLVLILPDVEMNTMKKVLDWSTFGQVTISRRELTQITDILKSLQVAVAISQDKVSPFSTSEDEVEVVQAQSFHRVRSSAGQVSGEIFGFFSQKMKATDENSNDPVPSNQPDAKRRKISSVAVESSKESTVQKKSSICKIESSSSGSIKQRNQSNCISTKADSNQLACLLCQAVFPVRHKLVQHLCFSHYRREMLEMWGQDDLDGPCPVCNRRLFAGKEGKGESYKQFNIICHLGGKHMGLLSVASEEVKAALEEGEAKVDVEGLAEAVNAAQRLFPKCRVCSRMGFHRKEALTSHVVHVHIRRALLREFGRKNLLRCDLCNADVRQMLEDAEYNALQHMMERHPQSVHETLPSELANLLIDSPEASTSGHCSGGRRTAEIPFEEGAEEYARKDGLICPTCGVTTKNRGVMIRHLCNKHFKKQLLDLEGISDDDDLRLCRLCGTRSGSDQMSASRLGTAMAEHIARKHGGMERIAALAAMDRELGLIGKSTGERRVLKNGKKEEQEVEEEHSDVNEALRMEIDIVKKEMVVVD